MISQITKSDYSKFSNLILKLSLVSLISRSNKAVIVDLPHNYSLLSGLRCVIAIIFIASMIFFQNVNAGWQIIGTGVSNDIWGVQFININTGWIIGTGGLIRKTTDSGNSWFTQTSNTSQILRRIRMFNADTGYITGHGGTILKTTNGGTNWTLYTRPGGNAFYGATDIEGSEFVYAAGSGLTYSKSTDGGNNWSNGILTGMSSFDIYALDVIDQNIFYISGAPTSIPAYPRIYKTTNGGANYFDVFNTTGITLFVNSSVNDIKFINQNTGFACFTNGVVAKTTNAGSTWNSTTLQFGTDLRQIDFLSSGDSGYISAFGGKIFYTTNTGASWNLIPESGTANNLTTVSLADGNKWCGGYAGTLVKYFPPQPRVIVSGALTGNGYYDKLSEAFASINGGSQSGANIVVTIDSNTTEPTSGAVLNNGSWASLVIKPGTGSGITVSGNTNAGVPLIDLNGADNVTIDGINSGNTSLSFSNASTSSAAGTSTIRFQNDATNNKITNCKIYGSSKTDFSTVAATVIFGGNAVSTGNDNNVISNCDVGPAGANLPACAIYFSGTTTTSTLNNSNDSIVNCNIYDFFNSAGNNAGIIVSAGTTAATISNNRFYQTSLRSSTTISTHSVIQINNTTGDGFKITGNTIGFASSSGTGVYQISGASGSIFYGIYLTAGATNANFISDNLISSISLTNNGAGVYMIQVFEGLTTVSNNTIGSLTSNGSIVFNSSFSAAEVLGIGISTTANTTVSLNKIGGFTTTGIPLKLYGIRFVCNGSNPVWVCSGNTVGGTASGSMNNTFSTSGTLLFGISAERFSGTPSITIENNIIRNLTSKAQGPSNSVGVSGIYLNFNSGNFTTRGNTIHSLSNTNTSVASTASGIKVISGSGSVSSNFIHSISATLTSSIINGILMTAGTCDFINNMISLGKDSAGNSVSTGCLMYGINLSDGIISNCRYNSVYLTGSPSNGNSNTHAFYSLVLNNDRNYYNNIFYNSRSNSGGTLGKHYAIVLAGSSPNPSGLTCNYNDLYVNGSGGTLGFFNNTNYTSLSSWQTATGKDSNSISLNPRIISHANLHIDSATQSPVSNAGITIPGVTNDFDDNLRNVSTPDIGADEFNSITSGEALHFDGTNDHVALPNSLTQSFTSPSVNEITIEYWFRGSNVQSAVRFQTSSSQYIVAGWVGGNISNPKHLISIEGGTGGGVKIGAGVHDGNWHHVAMTWKRNTVNGFRSYLDGVLVEAKNSVDAALPPLTSGGSIGAQIYNNSEYMNGSLDEVRIWTRALNQSEIAGNRFHEIDTATGLLASYHFNQGVAGGNNSGSATLTDATVNNYSGTLVNFALTGNSSNWITPGPGFCTPYIEANITGNNISIADGDVTPWISDFTDFGSISAGGTITRTYTVQNSGLDSLSVGNPFITGTDSSKFTAGILNSSGKIAPGGSATFTVIFNPGNSGVKNAVVHLPNNDCNEYDYDFAIKGTGNIAVAQTLNFDGIDDNVELPAALTQSLTSPTVTEFSIEYWFKGSYIQSAVRFQAAGGYWIVSGWGAQGNEKHLISTEGGTNGISVGTGVSDGNWHHVAMTWKKNTVDGFKSYLDGVLVDQKNSSNSDLPVMTVNGYLGKYNLGNEYMQGSLDEVRIWTRELSQQEIALNRFVQISYGQDLLASYHFNQGLAGENNSSVTTLTDASLNGFSGTLTNFALSGLTSNWISPSPFTCKQSSEISIKGNNLFILDGDSTASSTDFTDFGYLKSDSNRVNTFYIKNTGSDSLTVASIFVTGADAGKFMSGPLTPTGKIRPGDSASFNITFTPGGIGMKKAVVHIANNDCNESDYDFAIKGTGTGAVSITSIIQGFYDASSDLQNLSDTMRVYLCNSVSPFNAVDSAKQIIDSISHTGSFTFVNAPAGNYYVKLIHRNSIETWSASAINYPLTSSYDFTTAQSQSYGSNSIEVNASPVRYAIYSGDENGDGTIDVTDIVNIYNDVLNGTSGYVNTDINGDDYVDVSDIVIAYNNSINVVMVISP